MRPPSAGTHTADAPAGFLLGRLHAAVMSSVPRQDVEMRDITRGALLLVAFPATVVRVV
jgi:hypothetical protein